MRKYLFVNRSKGLAKIIFKTLDINEWTPWKYSDNLSVKCESAAETSTHFVSCKSYLNFGK